ncbi:MAG: hypothetical protein Q4A00_05395 [Flavobacteriaceae bacterium]|nr:hypothetical protein [Flavobacteriaceae bacterium]
MKQSEIDLEELEYALQNFQELYNIAIDDEELLKISSFEELLNLLVSKFNIETTPHEECKTQKTFYEVRKILMEVAPNTQYITPKTNLEELFPKGNRKSRLAMLKNKMGLKRLDILGMSPLEFWIMALGIIGSIISIFIAENYSWGMLSLAFFILFGEASRGNTFRVKNVGSLVKYILRERMLYDKSKMNIVELKEIITDYFAEYLDVESKELIKVRWGF